MKGNMSLLCFLAVLFAMPSCGSGNATETKEQVVDTVTIQEDAATVVGSDTATLENSKVDSGV